MKLLSKLLAGVVLAVMTLPSVHAKRMSDLRIYINPGHGGYTSDDRPIHIYPYERNDSLGYWESKSNLYKGLHMYHILDSLGAKPFLSRIKNTEDDDRSLSGIAAEANQLKVDLFFSIHSNAGETVNYPLMLYREQVEGTPRYPENVTLSEIVGKNIYSRKISNWTHSKPQICGDLTFYKNMWQGGLGVLRTLYTVGLLSEGSMHEHRPEAHRLMNDDYCWLEAWLFVKSIMEFYDTEDKFVTGNVAGVVYDDHNAREFVMPANFSKFGRDANAPVCGAFVELVDAQGKTIQTRTTDSDYNGVFVFRNVAPGEYTVRVTHSDYYVSETPVTVVANDVTYQDIPLNLRREAPLKVEAHAPAVDEGQLVSCASTIELDFNTDIDVPSFEAGFKIEPAVEGYYTYSNSYRHVSFTPTVSFERDTKYTVTIDKSVKSADTHFNHPQMEDNYVFSFTTRGRNRLEIIEHFPAEDGSVHYVSPQVEIRFDNTLDRSGVLDGISLTDSKGNSIPVNVRTSKFNTLSNNYGNVIVSFNSNLTIGEKYKFTISGSIRDKEGLPLNTDKVINFTAIDAASPESDTDEPKIFETFESAANLSYNEELSLGLAIKATASKSTSTKLFDKAAGRMVYKFADTHGGQAVWNYTGESEHFYTGDHLGMYVYGDFTGHELWAGLVSGTNTKYAKICDLNFLGWQYFEVNLDMLEADFCPFQFRQVKLIQTTSPITQNGAFALDNLSYISKSGGVETIVNDTDNTPQAIVDGAYINLAGVNPNATINLFSTTGALVTSVRPDDAGYARIAVSHLAHGIYIIAAGQHTIRIAI